MAVNKLAQFGHSFQIKSIVCLMTSPQYIEQIHDILDEKHYDSDAMKWIVKHCKEYFTKYNKPITFDVFKVKTDEVSNDVLKTTILEVLKEVYKHLESSDLDFVQDKSLDFSKTKH